MQEEEKFYSDKENGIPFIRVQNLSPTNYLLLDDLKYINKETHEGYLSRSQIGEGDLLVKITGVGRMAVASVAPNGFIGNTNQHLVIIKTDNFEVSETVATFLNTDIGEKLASRRATGGTRPALDYKALKSIPIVYKPEIVQIIKDAVKAKREKEAEAKELLAGIDAYLLDKLGIKPPTTDQPTKKTFFTALSKVTGNRFDAIYYASELFSFLEANKFQLRSLKELCNDLKSGFGAGKQDQSQDEKGLIQIRPTNIGNEGNLKFEKNVYLPIKLLESQQDIFLKEGDVLFNNTNSQELVGKTALFNNQGDFTFSNHITRIRVNEQILPLYLTLILNLYQHRKIFYSICTNWNNQSGVGVDLLKSIQIPLPPLEVQEEIANHIQNIRERAKQLETEAKAEIERAKAEVEAMILGK